MSEQPYDPALKAVEAALARLGPAPAALDRDRLMFRAGQASRPPGPRLWQGLAAALALLSASLTAVLLLRPPRVEVQTVTVYVHDDPRPDVADVATPGDAGRALAGYHRLQEEVLQHGLDALPAPVDAPQTDSLDKLFGEPGVWPRTPRSGI